MFSDGTTPEVRRRAADACAQAVHDEFYQTLQLLSNSGNKRILEMWEEDLSELHDKAQHLLTLDSLSESSKIRLRLITSRPVVEWEIIARDKNKTYYSY